MYELILERLHGRSEHDAPPLLLDLKDSENKEIISSNAEMLRNGLLNRKMQLYDNECDYVPTKCRKFLANFLKSKLHCKESRIEKIVEKCRALENFKTSPANKNSTVLRKHRRKTKKTAVITQNTHANTTRESVIKYSDGMMKTDKVLEAPKLVASNIFPKLSVKSHSDGVVLIWSLPEKLDHKWVQFYRIFAREKHQPWVELGQVESLRLPMGCRLNCLESNKCYNFKIQPVFSGSVFGQFSAECAYETFFQ